MSVLPKGILCLFFTVGFLFSEIHTVRYQTHSKCSNYAQGNTRYRDIQEPATTLHE